MKKNRGFTGSALVLALIMAVAIITSAAATGADAPAIVDTNPAIAVAANTQKSVVGVITTEQSWNRQTAETTEEMIGQGSGVVVRDGGYILTNYHVVDGGSSYQVILPSGEKADAQLVGSDESTDLAVLKVESSEGLVPCTIGQANGMPIGSTVIAIGNPGGEILANTVTSGIISALQRDVQSTNATRKILYIQHDAAISSGNSGGGLFDVNGRLIGINTLKYAGGSYAYYNTGTYEGLGFAIPMDVAEPIVNDLIEHGKVIRPQMGVTVTNYSGPDEPMNNYPPASVMVYTVNPGSPAADAGMQAYDFITAVDGVRVKTLQELTSELDKHQEGDTVEVTVVRYKNVAMLMGQQQSAQSFSVTPDSGSGDGSSDGSYFTDPFGGFFGNNPYGNYGGRSGRSSQNLGGYDEIKLNVTLKLLD